MSSARRRDRGRMQSGSVKGVIAPNPGPAEPDDPDGTISRRGARARALFLFFDLLVY
jgi:hypothetical protein